MKLIADAKIIFNYMDDVPLQIVDDLVKAELKRLGFDVQYISFGYPSLYVQADYTPILGAL